MFSLTNVLYPAIGMWLAGAVLMLRSRDGASLGVGGAWSLMGVTLLWLVFARYWGNGEGLLAATVLLLSVVATFAGAWVVGAARRFRAVRAAAFVDALWLLAAWVVALLSVFASPHAATWFAVDPYPIGGLHPQLRPVQREISTDAQNPEPARP